MTTSRTLIAVLAYNEAENIAAVVQALRRDAAAFDIVAINDGSRDTTADVLAAERVLTVSHLCNLGYGRAVQTAIKYAARRGYDAVVTFDGDGQHRAADVHHLVKEFENGQYDLLIGSRFCQESGYRSPAQSRRLGMWLFARLVTALTGQRLSDTTSGFRIFRRRIFDVVTAQPFADFHAETIVLLVRRGFKVGEAPIVVEERRAGTSMYSPISVLKYPLKTSLLVLLAFVGNPMTGRYR